MFRRSSSAAAQTQRRIVAVNSRFLVQQPELPFPKIDRAAGVEKGLARTQLELAQGLGTGCSAKAVELLAVNPEDEPEIAPAQNRAEDLIEFPEIEGIGYCDHTNDYGAHVAENSS